jgi:formamidopyrimidine-DNA glycosylase
MPELPEVETVARIVREQVTGAHVLRARAVAHEKWASGQFAEGRTIVEVRRRGKHLLLDLDGDETLDIHLGMTGVLRLLPFTANAGTPTPAAEKHERLLLQVTSFNTNSLLRLVDPRGFGHAVMATRDASGNVDLDALRSMGPEPLEGWTVSDLVAACARRSTSIKATILDQSVVAGIGNYLADEILFASGIHPETAADSLSRARLRKLHAAAQRIITSAVEAGGATLSDYRRPDGSSGDAQFLLQAYGRETEACLRCGRPMKKTVVAGRGTTFCSACQRH